MATGRTKRPPTKAPTTMAIPPPSAPLLSPQTIGIPRLGPEVGNPRLNSRSRGSSRSI
jgi:hypothetical protein